MRRTGRDYGGGPSYLVEHLATFGVGPHFDGIRKLKQMEKSSAIWAQKMMLRLSPNAIVLEDENGDVVEHFPLHLVSEPSAHLSTDTRDVHNNLLVFVVNEDKQNSTARSPTEMHIFHCVRISARDVVEDIGEHLRARFGSVKRGRSELAADYPATPPAVSSNQEYRYTNGGGGGGATTGPSSNGHTPHREHNVNIRRNEFDTESVSMGFEKDVNSLNRCFDDIERFVARIQSAALAQREVEANQKRRDSKSSRAARSHLDTGNPLPSEAEFVDIFKKFKHCFNILAKLRSHIHEPNAPELLHFLFTPLTVILDACHWGLGKNVAVRVVSPLITRDATSLLQHSLTSKEYDVWMSLGETWKTPAEEWNGDPSTPYTPTFLNGFNKDARNKQQSSSRYVSSDQVQPSPQQRVPPKESSSTTVDGERRLDARFLANKEKYLNEKEAKLAKLQRDLRDEQQKVKDMMERVSLTTPDREVPIAVKTSSRRAQSQIREPRQESSQNSPAALDGAGASAGESPRQSAFFDNLKMKRAKVARATYDRVGQNPKELTVSKDEFLEVLNDTKNWWECRNVYNRIGFVPNTILHMIYDRGGVAQQSPLEQPISIRVPGASASSGPPSAALHNGARDQNGGGPPRDRREWITYSDYATNEHRTQRTDRRY